MSKVQWLMVAALAMFMVAPALSQQKAEPPKNKTGATQVEASSGFEFQKSGPNVTFRQLGQPFPTATTNESVSSQYWLGIYCSPVPAVLRSHVTMPEKQGLVAISVSKDGPAARAGIIQYDILLRVGGKSLNDPHDLVAAVDAAKETKLKIDLIRGGRLRTVEVTPAKRPAPVAGAPVPVAMPDQADWNTIENWLESMIPGQGNGGVQPPAQFRIFQPGAILPKNILGQKSLPANVSVSITKDGDQPAKISVQRGSDKWELTEKDLDKLPADIRPFVEQMLGRGMMGVVGGFSGGGGAFQFSSPSAGATLNVDQQTVEKRFGELNRRMDQLFKMMEELAAGHGQRTAPEHPQNK